MKTMSRAIRRPMTFSIHAEPESSGGNSDLARLESSSLSRACSDDADIYSIPSIELLCTVCDQQHTWVSNPKRKNVRRTPKSLNGKKQRWHLPLINVTSSTSRSYQGWQDWFQDIFLRTSSPYRRPPRPTQTHPCGFSVYTETVGRAVASRLCFRP
jgi:hypothetical protein